MMREHPRLQNNVTSHNTAKNFPWRPTLWIAISLLPSSNAFVPLSWQRNILPKPQTLVVVRQERTCLFGKRNKRQQAKEDMDDVNRWYDAVKSDATPDGVFWEEMERQRMMTEIGNTNGDTDDMFPTATASTATTNPTPVASLASSVATFQNNIKPNAAVEKQQQERSVEATLTEYAAYAVSDNYLNDEFLLQRYEAEEEQLRQQEQQQKEQDDYLEGKDSQLGVNGKDTDDGVAAASDTKQDDEDDLTMMKVGAEPWDVWGLPREVREQVRRLKPNYASEYLYTEEDDNDEEEADRMEAELVERLSKLRITSPRLEKARNNPKAAAFFAREPDAVQGYDQMWVCAVDYASFANLKGVFRNYGVQFADNFADFEDGCAEDGFFSVEDVASHKARQVYEATGLPCIASRTSFEIEPILPGQETMSNPNNARGSSKNSNLPIGTNPRVASGYWFNDVGMHVDHLVEALKPLSEPTRVTRFKTCVCYYDGDMEVYDYGFCDCDIHWCDSTKTFISVATAISQLSKTLQLTFGLEYQKWLKYPMGEESGGIDSAVKNLRDRVLKDGKVLPNDIVDVSNFMDSMVDVNLMDECAKALVSPALFESLFLFSFFPLLKP